MHSHVLSRCDRLRLVSRGKEDMREVMLHRHANFDRQILTKEISKKDKERERQREGESEGETEREGCR
jgi:hypothetical protein